MNKYNANLMDDFVDEYDSPFEYRERLDYRVASHNFAVLRGNVHILTQLDIKSPSEAKSGLFYILNQKINYNIAYNFGFGVVKFKVGRSKGKEALYYFNKMDSIRKKEEEAVKEVLALTAYLQYMNPNCISEGLKTLLSTKENLMKLLVYNEAEEMIRDLKEIVSK